MLLTHDEQEMLDYIKEQLELDAVKGLVDLKDSMFCEYSSSQKEAIFNKLKKSGFVIDYSTTDFTAYQVEMHPDFLIEPV